MRKDTGVDADAFLGGTGGGRSPGVLLFEDSLRPVWSHGLPDVFEGLRPLSGRDRETDRRGPARTSGTGGLRSSGSSKRPPGPLDELRARGAGGRAGAAQSCSSQSARSTTRSPKFPRRVVGLRPRPGTGGGSGMSPRGLPSNSSDSSVGRGRPVDPTAVPDLPSWMETARAKEAATPQSREEAMGATGTSSSSSSQSLDEPLGTAGGTGISSASSSHMSPSGAGRLLLGVDRAAVCVGGLASSPCADSLALDVDLLGRPRQEDVGRVGLSSTLSTKSVKYPRNMS